MGYLQSGPRPSVQQLRFISFLQVYEVEKHFLPDSEHLADSARREMEAIQ